MHSFSQRSQVLIGYEDGMVRVLDLKTFKMVAEWDCEAGYSSCNPIILGTCIVFVRPVLRL